MKIVLPIALILLLTLPSSAQLTKRDVEQIIQKALEPIKMEIAEIRGEIKAIKAQMATKDDIISLQREMTKRMDEMRSELVGRMEKSDERVNSRIDSLYHQLWAVWSVIFVTILAAIFGGPIFAEWKRIRVRLST